MIFIKHVIAKSENFEVMKEEYWKKAMEDEIEAIPKNHTSELVDELTIKEILGVKWIYKVKHNSDDSIQIKKTRLVAKGQLHTIAWD